MSSVPLHVLHVPYVANQNEFLPSMKMGTVKNCFKIEYVFALISLFAVFYLHFMTRNSDIERASKNSTNDQEKQPGLLLEPSFDISFDWLLFIEDIISEPKAVLSAEPYKLEEELTSPEMIDGTVEELGNETLGHRTPHMGFVYVVFKMNVTPPPSWDGHKKKDGPNAEKQKQEQPQQEPKKEESKHETAEGNVTIRHEQLMNDQRELKNRQEILAKGMEEKSNQTVAENRDGVGEKSKISGESN